MSARNEKIAISLLIVTAFAVVFWKYSSIPALSSVFLQAKPALIIAALVVYVGIYVLRAWRFTLISPVKNFSANFFLTSIHNLYNNILPANLGELSYPFFANRRYAVPYSAGFSTIVLARLFDVINLALILAGGAVSFIYHGKIALILVALLIIDAGIVLALWKMRVKIAGRFPRFGERAFTGWTFNQYIGAGILSLAISVAMFADSVLVMRGLGVTVPLLFILLGNSLSLLSGILPIEGPLGIGTIEASWTLPLLAAGVSASVSLADAVGYHVVTLIFCMLLALPALLTYIF
jgi:uncharacterized membrane protein YbhN (UPF0104 family)